MEETKFREIVDQNVLVQHLLRSMGEEIYSGLFDKRSLKRHKREIVKELNKLIKIATSNGGSFSGRTMGLDPVNVGSNPTPPEHKKE